MEECLDLLEKKELDPAHCNLWRLPPGTKLMHFVKDNQVCAWRRLAVVNGMWHAATWCCARIFKNGNR